MSTRHRGGKGCRRTNPPGRAITSAEHARALVALVGALGMERAEKFLYEMHLCPHGCDCDRGGNTTKEKR